MSWEEKRIMIELNFERPGTCILLAITLVNASACSDDDDDPIIQGDIIDGESNPVPNAAVELYREFGTVAICSTTSDSNGDFTFQEPAGNYFIKVTPTGCSTTTTNVFSVPQSGYLITIVV